MIVIYHFEAKNSKKNFGPNATSGECTIFISNIGIIKNNSSNWVPDSAGGPVGRNIIYLYLSNDSVTRITLHHHPPSPASDTQMQWICETLESSSCIEVIVEPTPRHQHIM